MLPLMEVVLNFELWITLCIVGFLAGLIDAIAGGGGMLTVPTLLTAGLPPHVALTGVPGLTLLMRYELIVYLSY